MSFVESDTKQPGPSSAGTGGHAGSVINEDKRTIHTNYLTKSDGSAASVMDVLSVFSGQEGVAVASVPNSSTMLRVQTIFPLSSKTVSDINEKGYHLRWRTSVVYNVHKQDRSTLTLEELGVHFNDASDIMIDITNQEATITLPSHLNGQDSKYLSDMGYIALGVFNDHP